MLLNDEPALHRLCLLDPSARMLVLRCLDMRQQPRVFCREIKDRRRMTKDAPPDRIWQDRERTDGPLVETVLLSFLVRVRPWAHNGDGV
jgi:hypothetical protein